jgi:hypothetical protein
MILFNQVVQLFRKPNCGPFAAMMLFDYGMARPSCHDPFREGMSCLWPRMIRKVYHDRR